MGKKYSVLLKSSIVVLGLVFAAGFDTGHALAKSGDKDVKKVKEDKARKAADEKVKDAEGKVKEADEAKWEEQAEKSFGVGRGVGKKLMTKEEWREHQRKMQSMTPEEKEAYREEVHQSLKERAKEKGITIPDEPGPHGHGKGMMDGKGMMGGTNSGTTGGGTSGGDN